MSYISVPDTRQPQNITVKDSIKLTLISTARLGAGLSKLIGAIAEKILFTVKESGFDRHFLYDVVNINKALDQILVNTVKLQLLLQSRIEYAQSFFDSVHGIKAATSSATSVQPIEPEQQSYPLPKSSFGTEEECKYSLKGRGVGFISNHFDPFHNGIGIIQTCICHPFTNTKDNFLCYSVHKGNAMEIFSAFSSDLKIKCHTKKESRIATIEGTGSIVYKERFKPDTEDTAAFILTIRYENNKCGKNSFQFVIKPDNRTALCHDSGEIILESPSLIIETIGRNESTASFLNSVANEELLLANAMHMEAEKIQSSSEEPGEKAESKRLTTMEELVELCRNAEHAIKQVLKQEMEMGTFLHFN